MAAVAQIVITIEETGQISVAAPFANDILCYGLLEKAKDVVRSEHEKLQRRIQPVTPADLAVIKPGAFGPKS